MFNRFSLTHRFWTTVFVFWVVFALAMVAGIYGLIQSRDSLKAVHEDRMITFDLLHNMEVNFNDTRINMLLAFQHDPTSALYSLHGHPVKDHLDEIEKSIQNNISIQNQLADRDIDAREVELIDDIVSARAAWNQKVAAAQRRVELGDFSPSVMLDFLVAGRTEGKAFDDALSQMQQYQLSHANTEAQLAERRYQMMRLLFALIVLFGAIPMTWFMLLTLRRMSRGFDVANDTAQAIAQGDLSRQIHMDGNDEITHLLTQINLMQQNLRQLISRINHSASNIVAVANEVADSSILLSERTDQQASSLAETSSATEELNSTVQQNADNAREAEGRADQAGEVARRGGVAVNNVVSTMDDIRTSSEKINDIVGIIDSIAFQTNILALNAAVEAARAGEQGRGFAVVASEVRALAQRSAAAANEVKMVVENSVDTIQSGSGQVTEAGETMQDIVSNNERMIVLIREIAAASQEQSVGLNQINQAINLMDEMTHQNVSLVEQTTETAHALRVQADELASYVSAFQLGDVVDVNARPHNSAPALSM